MYHTSPLFSQEVAREWLVYFKRSYKTFSLSITGEEKDYAVSGQYKYSGNFDIFLRFDVQAGPLELDLKADPMASWHKRLFGSAPLTGTLVLAGTPIGTCRVENSYEQSTPMIRLETHLPPRKCEVYQSNVACPFHRSW